MKKIIPAAIVSFPTTVILGYQHIEHDEIETSGWIFCAHRIVNRPIADASPRPQERQAIQNVIRRRERDPLKKAALDRARARLSATLDKSEGPSLTALRLSKGLSQTKLAEMIGQKQPYVARLEKERQDLRSRTISKLAAALDVSTDTIIELTQPEDDND